MRLALSAYLLLVSSGTSSLIHFWILLAHIMCLNRLWLEMIKSYNAGIVLMGNYAMCKVIGMGAIKVRMFDEVVTSLTNVKYT
jgi:hypothetical protein